MTTALFKKIPSRPRAFRLTVLSLSILKLLRERQIFWRRVPYKERGKRVFKLEIFWMNKKITIGFDFVWIGCTDSGGVKPSSICIILFIFILSLVQLLIIYLLARSKHFWWLDSQNRGNPEIWMLVMHYEKGFSKTALIWISDDYFSPFLLNCSKDGLRYHVNKSLFRG